MNTAIFVGALLFGFLFNKSLSKNGGKINKRLPFLKIKFLQFSPNVKIHIKSKSIHLHHWLTYAAILIITFTSTSIILDSVFSKGYLVGGILQGLTFQDWKKIVVSKN